MNSDLTNSEFQNNVRKEVYERNSSSSINSTNSGSDKLGEPVKLSSASSSSSNTIQVEKMVDNRPPPPGIPEFLAEPRKYKLTREMIEQYIEEETLLTFGVKTQNVDAVDEILKSGADANQLSRKGITPISAAAHKGNVRIMELLIEKGANVNTMNTTGSTALIQASHFGHLEAVKLLLRHNAQADFANSKGTTALMRASQEGHVEITKCLIEAKVKVNRKNHEGMNALMLASQRGHANIVQVLVQAGADMDERTTQGSTALMLACKRGHEKCTEVLVSLGAEIYMQDRRGRTARDTALRRSHDDLLRWLDSQVQVKLMQQNTQKIREKILVELRNASLAGRLQLAPPAAFSQALHEAVQQTEDISDDEMSIEIDDESTSIADEERFGSIEVPNFDRNSGLISPNVMASMRAVSPSQLLKRFLKGDRSLPIVSTTPYETVRLMKQIALSRKDEHDWIDSLPTFANSAVIGKRTTGYLDWQWPQLLNRCFNLPTGIFELIMEMMPLPRIWRSSLHRLRRRCDLAPRKAIQDMSIIIDEIITDLGIFAGRDQSNQCIKLSRTPQAYSYLVERRNMPVDLLQALIDYSATQGMLMMSNEEEVTFTPAFARKMFTITTKLYSWYASENSATKLFHLAASKLASAGNGVSHSSDDGRIGKFDDDLDLMEATDAGGDFEGSDEDVHVRQGLIVGGDGMDADSDEGEAAGAI